MASPRQLWGGKACPKTNKKKRVATLEIKMRINKKDEEDWRMKRTLKLKAGGQGKEEVEVVVWMPSERGHCLTRPGSS
jgi:hypothetical protein